MIDDMMYVVFIRCSDRLMTKLFIAHIVLEDNQINLMERWDNRI